jgi:hypothetical protein
MIFLAIRRWYITVSIFICGEGMRATGSDSWSYRTIVTYSSMRKKGAGRDFKMQLAEEKAKEL